MQILVNGEARTVEPGLCIADLLALYNLHPQRVAVEVNEQLVRRATFAETSLNDNDRVEIVTLVGGG